MIGSISFQTGFVVRGETGTTGGGRNISVTFGANGIVKYRTDTAATGRIHRRRRTMGIFFPMVVVVTMAIVWMKVVFEGRRRQNHAQNVV